MQYYQQQFNAMVDALLAERLSPSAPVAASFKRARVNAVSKALSMVNAFVPAVGNFPIANSNSTYTIYTKPLNRDVIVMGCALASADTLQKHRIVGEFRVRLPEPLSHLSQNYLFPALGFAPATYSVFFPAPFILRAGEQIAIDFGYNAPQGTPREANTAPTTIQQEIVFFCALVKDCLTSDDLEVLEVAKRVIQESDYQRRVFLNSYTPGSRMTTPVSGAQFLSNQDNGIVYTPANTVGTLTSSVTRSADVPLLVVGVGHTLCNSRLRITDTGTGHSFTQGEFIRSNNIYYQQEGIVLTAYRSAYYSYFRLPVPHLLRPGATLFIEHLNGGVGDDPADAGAVRLMWECLKV